MNWDVIALIFKALAIISCGGAIYLFLFMIVGRLSQIITLLEELKGKL